MVVVAVVLVVVVVFGCGCHSFWMVTAKILHNEAVAREEREKAGIKKQDSGFVHRDARTRKNCCFQAPSGKQNVDLLPF